MSEHSKYPLVPLAEVLTQDEDYVTELEPRLYLKLSVKLYGKGVVLDEPTDGGTVRMKRHQLAQPGQVILSEIWAKRGAIGLVPEEGAGALVTSHFFLFDIDESTLLRSLLGWLLAANYFEPVLSGEARGTTGYAAVRPRQFLACQVPLPPLPEQRHIVARIEELAALIEEARSLRVGAREEAEVLLAAAVRTVFDNHQWAHINVGELVGQENLRNGKSVEGTDLSADIHCLRLSSLRGGRIDCTDAKPVPMTRQEAEPYLIRVGDVFIVRGSGSKALVGRAGRVEKCVEGTIFPDLLIRVPLDKNRILPTFFVGWWNSPQMHGIIEDAARTTSGIWKVNQKHIASFSVPLPPLSEQRRIVAYLDRLQAQVDELAALQQATQAELDALLPSVLERAFRGEL